MRLPIATVKKLVRERDNFRCVECGMTNQEHLERYDSILDVHRKLANSRYTVDGCETLCRPCHARKRGGPKWQPTEGEDVSDLRATEGQPVCRKNRFEVRMASWFRDCVIREAHKAGVSTSNMFLMLAARGLGVKDEASALEPRRPPGKKAKLGAEP